MTIKKRFSSFYKLLMKKRIKIKTMQALQVLALATYNAIKKALR